VNAAETHETFHWESGMRYQLALIGPIHGRIGPVSLLRSDPRTSRIPVVALSALPLDAGDDWFLDAGFAGYVVKPIDTDEFADLVRRFCAGGPD